MRRLVSINAQSGFEVECSLPLILTSIPQSQNRIVAPSDIDLSVAYMDFLQHARLAEHLRVDSCMYLANTLSGALLAGAQAAVQPLQTTKFVRSR